MVYHISCHPSPNVSWSCWHRLCGEPSGISGTKKLSMIEAVLLAYIHGLRSQQTFCEALSGRLNFETDKSNGKGWEVVVKVDGVVPESRVGTSWWMSWVAMVLWNWDLRGWGWYWILGGCWCDDDRKKTGNESWEESEKESSDRGQIIGCEGVERGKSCGYDGTVC